MEIVPLYPDVAKECANVLGPVGMAFFPGLAGVVGHLKIGLVVERFEQAPAIFEQCLAQAQFDRLHVGDTLADQTFADQLQEGGGLLELFVGDLLRLEFFFESFG